MKSLSIISSILLATTLSGCSNNVPKCGDDEVLDIVKQVSDETMTNQLAALKMFGIGEGIDTSFTYSVEAIRTTNTNSQTGAHECAAQLSMLANGTNNPTTIPITYTIEMTDQGDEFYVTVFGLQ